MSSVFCRHWWHDEPCHTQATNTAATRCEKLVGRTWLIVQIPTSSWKSLEFKLSRSWEALKMIIDIENSLKTVTLTTKMQMFVTLGPDSHTKLKKYLEKSGKRSNFVVESLENHDQTSVTFTLHWQLYIVTHTVCNTVKRPWTALKSRAIQMYIAIVITHRRLYVKNIL